MKTIIIKLISFTTFMQLFVYAGAQTDLVPDSLIKKAILTFTKAVDSLSVQQFGVQSIAELKSLKPGKQFKYFTIGLNDIKKFSAGDNVKDIIKEYPSIEVSLTRTSGQIVTSMEFVKKKGSWEVAALGSSTQLIILSRSQSALSNEFMAKGQLIRIPGLMVSFLAVTSGSGTKFMSLEDIPLLKLVKGQQLSATEAIVRMVPLAKKQKKTPR